MRAADGRHAMNLHHNRYSRGTGLWENLLVVILVAVLVVVAYQRFVALRVQAERLAMDQVLADLRSVTLEHALHLGASGAAADPTANPVNWLPQPPSNYMGALAGPDPATVPAGQWYFDTRAQLLVYRVDHAAYFDSPLQGAARARFKLIVHVAANRTADAQQATDGSVLALAIKPVESYSWRTAPREISAWAVWGIFGASP